MRLLRRRQVSDGIAKNVRFSRTCTVVRTRQRRLAVDFAVIPCAAATYFGAALPTSIGAFEDRPYVASSRYNTRYNEIRVPSPSGVHRARVPGVARVVTIEI